MTSLVNNVPSVIEFIVNISVFLKCIILWTPSQFNLNRSMATDALLTLLFPERQSVSHGPHLERKGVNSSIVVAMFGIKVCFN